MRGLVAAMRLLLLVLVGGLLLLGATGAADAGMRVGATVCPQAIAISCVGGCVETILSPPDLCPTVHVPI
jgi:hypothetical protein